MALPGQLDIDIDILNRLNDRDLVSYCSTHKDAREICNNQTFWQRRTFSRYGKLITGEEMNKYRGDLKWHDYYIELMKAEKEKYPEYLLAKSMENGRKDIETILENKGAFVRFTSQTFEDRYRDESYHSKTGHLPELQGKYVSYYPNGKIESQGEYFYGKRIGKHTSYYENGKIDNVQNFKLMKDISSVLDGEQLKYEEDGKLIVKELFKDGKLVNREFFN